MNNRPAEPLDIAALARRVTELPPLPQAVLEVMLALQREQLSASRSITLIEQDPALAARVLRLANSAFYGMAGRVGSIGDAVRMLGLRIVAGVLLAVAMHNAIRVEACAGFHFPDYWRHAIASALAARALAAAAGCDADEAFLAGLMHDIGQLALAAFEPDKTARALALARSAGLSTEAAELVELGLSHPGFGARVAQHWRFPATICQAIALHHRPGPASAGKRISLSGLVQLADAVAQGLDLNPGADEAIPAVPATWQCLGLDDAEALRILATVKQATHEMSAILQTA